MIIVVSPMVSSKYNILVPYIYFMIKLNQLNLEHNNLKNILQNKHLGDCSIIGMT